MASPRSRGRSSARTCCNLSNRPCMLTALVECGSARSHVRRERPSVGSCSLFASQYVNSASRTLPRANSCRSAPYSPEDEGDLPPECTAFRFARVNLKQGVIRTHRRSGVPVSGHSADERPPDRFALRSLSPLRTLHFATISRRPGYPPRTSGDSPPSETDSAYGSLIVEEKLRRIRVNPNLGQHCRRGLHQDGGAGSRHRRHRVNPLRGSCAGAAALAGDTAPWAPRRLAMAGRIPPAIVGPAEKNTERTSRTEAMARADQCAAGAGDEDLVRRAAPDSAAGPSVAPEPAAGVFTRGLRAIAAFRRSRPRTER